MRSISRFGLSAVTVVFKDHVNVYFARQLVAERLLAAKEQIAPGFGAPQLGPVTTGLGEVYQFVVRGDGYTPCSYGRSSTGRSPTGSGGPGVTEVSPEGGYASSTTWWSIESGWSHIESHRSGL
jgi:cobalt-zinc-cadmium resistance protein CzcA